MTISVSLVQGAYIVAGLLFIMALAGLSKHETAPAGNRYGIIGMTVALVITISAAVLGVETASGAVEKEGTGITGVRAHPGGHGDRRGDRHLAGARGRDDRHARADRHAAQLRGPGRCPGRLEQLLRDRPGLSGHPRRRGVRGRVHRRGDLHRLDRRVPEALGEDQVRAPDAPCAQRDQPGHHRRVLRDDRRLRDGPARRPRRAPVAAGPDDPARPVPRLAPRGLHRRRRHARRRVHAQQLLRLGGGRGRLPAQQRPADHHRRPGRVVRCLPVLHHVPGDEPLVHLASSPAGSASRPAPSPPTSTTASTGRSPPRGPRTCSPRRTPS